MLAPQRPRVRFPSLLQIKKTCTRCKQEKLLQDFTRDSSQKEGHYSACKLCKRFTARIRHKGDNVAQARNKLRVQQTSQMIRDKKSSGCIVCGELEPVCLDLHHTDPSKKDVDPNKLWNRVWDKFMQEAQKCIVVCSNCHKKIHAGMIVSQCDGTATMLRADQV